MQNVEYFKVQEDGDLFQIDSFTGNGTDVYIVVDHKNRMIFLWKGIKAGIKLKFIGSRTMTHKRMEVGHHYRTDTIDEGDISKAFEKTLKVTGVMDISAPVDRQFYVDTEKPPDLVSMAKQQGIDLSQVEEPDNLAGTSVEDMGSVGNRPSRTVLSELDEIPVQPLKKIKQVKSDKTSKTVAKVSKSSVKAPKVSKSSVKASKVSKFSVKASKVSKSSVKASKVSKFSVKASKVSKSSVKAPKVSKSSVKAPKVSKSSVKAPKASKVSEVDEDYQSKLISKATKFIKTHEANEGYTRELIIIGNYVYQIEDSGTLQKVDLPKEGVYELDVFLPRVICSSNRVLFTELLKRDKAQHISSKNTFSKLLSMFDIDVIE